MKLLIRTVCLIAAVYLSAACSYVSDYVEGQITTRASFSINAVYNSETDSVDITWSETDTSDDFAGIEIYRSKNANDEFAPYEYIANKFNNSYLGNEETKTYTDSFYVPLPTRPGTYFYRVGFIHYDDKEKSTETYYNSDTHINKISGYAKVFIP